MVKQEHHTRKYKSGKVKLINWSIFKWKKKKKGKPEPEPLTEEEKMIKDIIAFEKSLPSLKNHDFTWLPGGGNVILSAPHAVKHYRRVLVKFKADEDSEEKEIIKSYVKGADGYTGGIVHILNKLTNMPTILLTRPGTWDPNIYDGVPYKTSLKNRAGGKVLLLDIHGAKIDRNFDIALGTIDNESLLDHPGYLDSLMKHLKRAGIKRISVNPKGFNAGGKDVQHTVTYYASHILKIPSIQIEINERYRNPHKYPENVIKLVDALRDFLDE